MAGVLSAETAIKYGNIIAVDVIPAEKIAALFSYSSRVLPLQLDLTELLGDTEFIVNHFKDTLRSVQSVIHVAGIVDTRETPEVRRKLDLINVQATTALVDLAAECGVSNFVYVSSASADIESRLNVPAGLRAWLKVLGAEVSMLSSMKMSTYGRTKLAAERAVLSKGCSSNLKVAVVRPHVVWGRGDTLSTEILLEWNPQWPEISIGDPSTPVASGRVDIIASFILMADVLLTHSEDEADSGRIFNICDDITSLKGIHHRIFKCRHVKDTLLADLSLDQCSAGAMEGDTGEVFGVWLVNTYMVVLLMVALEWVQYLCPAWAESFLNILSNYFRLLTTNNLAYSSGNYVKFPSLKNYEKDCEFLYIKSHGLTNLSIDASRKRFQLWKANLPCDRTILCKDWFDSILRKTLVTSVSNRTPCKETVLSSPCHIGPITIQNRVIKAATFECMAGKDGVPTDELGRFHARNAAGGVGMTVVAYASVSSDGRSFPTQICLNSGDENIDKLTTSALKKLCNDVHCAREGALVALQLTHAGAFADATYNCGAPPRGPSAILNPLTLKYSVSLKNDYETLDRILSDFVAAVDICRRVGFDAIELHLGHGYLLSQFLSAATNPAHKGNPRERLKFPLQVLKAVCARAHKKDERYIAVLVKFNVSEIQECDLSQSDGRLFARSFVDAGADLLVPSGGHVMVNGLHMLRGGRPLREMAEAQQQRFKKWVIAVAGKYFVKKEEFREAFFRERVISVMLGAGIPLSKVCLVGGVHELSTADCAVRHDGFLCVQLGRVLLADPDWCIKVGAFNVEKFNKAQEAAMAGENISGNKTVLLKDVSNVALKVCDNSNKCIIGSTMALEPLRCTKHGQIPEW